MLGGSLGRLGRARPQQSGLGCSWCIPGNILMDFACPRPHRVVLAAERHRSGRAQSVGPAGVGSGSKIEGWWWGGRG